MARGIDFRKLRLREYTAGPFKLLFMPVSARGLALFTQQDICQLRKGLELYYKLCISSHKPRRKLKLIGFSYDTKSANAVMWKDKGYEYIACA